MNRMALRAAVIAAALLVFAGGVNAQVRRNNYDLQPMSFDLWCQESMSLASERCAKRLPADVEAFEAFRSRIEGYEIEHQQQKNREARIQTDILHGDAVDRSPTRSLQKQGQQGGIAPPHPSTVP